MNAPAESSSRDALWPYVVPFAIFLAGIAAAQGLGELLENVRQSSAARAEVLGVPLQTLLCAGALVFFWRRYDFGPQRVVPLAIGVGLAVFALWVSPQVIFGQPPRTDGFDPSVFASDPTLYWSTVAARFLRLVVIVPLVEEIFWRGFLQRYLVDERFTSVPFGKYTPLSFWGVAVAFTLVHVQADWPAAFVTGAIYGWVFLRTKSLLACVLAHAVTNLALGVYIMRTQQWGFW